MGTLGPLGSVEREPIMAFCRRSLQRCPAEPHLHICGHFCNTIMLSEIIRNFDVFGPPFEGKGHQIFDLHL